MTEDQQQKNPMRMEENRKRRKTGSTGRKPKTDPAVFRYGIKLTSEENGNFELLFEKSGMKQRARFIKATVSYTHLTLPTILRV